MALDLSASTAAEPPTPVLERGLHDIEHAAADTVLVSFKTNTGELVSYLTTTAVLLKSINIASQFVSEHARQVLRVSTSLNVF